MSDITIIANEALNLLKSENYNELERKLNKIIELDKPKKRGRKSKLDLTLEKLGYTREEMQKFWDEALEVNKKIQLIARCGKDWKDLNEYQLADLVNLKEKTLAKIAEQEAKEKAKLEAEKKKAEEEKYYREHFEEIICNKILNGEELSDKEYRSLVYEYDYTEIDRSDVYKNSQYVTTICDINNHYFSIRWRDDLTDWGEPGFYNKPVEVKRVSKQTGYDMNMKPIYVENWEAVKTDNVKKTNKEIER